MESNSNDKKQGKEKNIRDRTGLLPNVAGNFRGRKAASELLTEAQKKQHHIASEQKRRRNIKLGYDRLCQIVPNVISTDQPLAQPPSEVTILQKSVEYINYQIEKQKELERQLIELKKEAA